MPVADWKRRRASAPCEGAEAFVVQKELFPGMGREPISHILLQGRQTLEGVASLGFLPARNGEARDQDIALRRWGTGAGLPKPSTSLERTDEDFGPKADWTGSLTRADGGEIRCLYAREL